MPQEVARISLNVAAAGAYDACSRIEHRIAWNIVEPDRAVADHARSELASMGLWSDSPDLPGAVARLTSDRVKPDGLAERTLSMGALAAAVYIFAREADALGVILAHETKPHLAKRLVDVEPRLLSARESLTAAVDRFVQALDTSVSPAVREAATVLANANSAEPPRWNGPDAKQVWRSGKLWPAALYESLRKTCVALEFPPERSPATESDAERALVQAILAQPDDDALRHQWIALASARGEVRAELARAQLRTRDERRRRRDALVFDSELVRSLVARHPEWQTDVKRLGATAAWFYRGFVEEIEIDADVLLARASELLGVAPILHLRLRGGAACCLEALLASGILDRMLAIDLAHQRLDDAHAEMLASRGLTNLRSLTLDGNLISEAGALSLYASESLRQLVYLSLNGNPCGPLAESGWSYAEYPTRIVELTPLGAKLHAQLGSRSFLYPLSPPSFDVLTV